MDNKGNKHQQKNGTMPTLGWKIGYSGKFKFSHYICSL
jgi:hypothetical protein